jgi:serine/threonine protein kinase
MLKAIRQWVNQTPVPISVDTPLPGGHDLRGYRIERLIHRGGMSWVYKAWDPKGKPVVIKEFFPHTSALRSELSVAVLPGREAFFREAFRRFHEEGRYMGLMRGTHYVTVRTFFRFHGTAYMVLEWERGRTLGAYLKVPRTQWPTWQQILPFVRDVRNSLHAMHQLNILHLDLHPANVMLTLRKGAVLLDFGAARHMYEPVLNTSRFFTLGYSAPEVKNGNYWGPWSDVYSFGCCLRALGVLRDDQPYPAAVKELVRKCLIEDPRLRIQGFGDPQFCAVLDI